MRPVPCSALVSLVGSVRVVFGSSGWKRSLWNARGVDFRESGIVDFTHRTVESLVTAFLLRRVNERTAACRLGTDVLGGADEMAIECACAGIGV
jgi:hypothetical protein